MRPRNACFLVAIASLQTLGIAADRSDWVRRAARSSRLIGDGVNAFSVPDDPAKARPLGEGGTGSDEASEEREGRSLQDRVADFRTRNRYDNTRSGMVMPDEVLEDGTPKDHADALKALAEDDTIVEGDEFGPYGPGRRERLAEIAGLSAEEARMIWPFPDPGPIRMGDMAQASKLFGGEGMTLTQDDVISRLVPEQNRERKEKLKRTVLNDAEVNFSCYAALGLPFPVRVGRVDEVPPEGLVIFVPEMLHADSSKDYWSSRSVTYRWMVRDNEVASGQLEVSSYAHLPRPSAPVTHLWITCDQDVMLYALRGIAPPATLSEVRSTLFKEVVQVNSWLRPPTKLYGIRWGLLPSLPEITDQPQTRVRIRQLMLDLGFITATDLTPDFKKYMTAEGEGGGK